jgi:hypothetical protein
MPFYQEGGDLHDFRLEENQSYGWEQILTFVLELLICSCQEVNSIHGVNKVRIEPLEGFEQATRDHITLDRLQAFLN